MKRTFFLSLLLLPLLLPQTVRADDYNLCSFPTAGNATISRSCVIYEDVNGVTDGNLTIDNAYVTLNRTLVFPIGKKIDVINDAIVYMNTGGAIKQGTLCVKDSDHDGYAEIKTLTTDPNLGTALATPIAQIDQIYSANGTCNSAAGYVNRTEILDISLADTNVNPSGLASTIVTDRELLRLGFRIGNVVDSYAAGRPVTVYNDNLFVYSSTPSAYSFNPANGNLYVQNKIGIGKTNPSYALDVSGTINGTALYVGGAPYIGSQWTTSSSDIYYTTGKVGIGRTNPTARLHVTESTAPGSGVSPYGIIVTNTVTAGQTNNYPQNSIQTAYDTASTTQASIFGLTTYAYKTNTGPITQAIGSLSSVYNTNATGAITNGYDYYAQLTPSTTGPVTNHFGFYSDSLKGSNVTNAWGIYLSGANDLNYFAGNVGIGITNPSYKLHVVGTLYAGGSSREYKENIAPLVLDPSKIYQLNPVTYDYKPQYKDLGKKLSGGRQFGLIAEDVYQIYPELTLSDGTKNVANVDYEKLSVILLAEMKNQKKEIDVLKKQVKDLNDRLIQIEAKFK